MTIFYVFFDAYVSFHGSLNHGDGMHLRISSQEGSSRKGFFFALCSALKRELKNKQREEERKRKDEEKAKKVHLLSIFPNDQVRAVFLLQILFFVSFNLILFQFFLFK